ANHISASTCRRVINEGIDLFAEWAIRLSEVLRLVKKAGREYLLIDGSTSPPSRSPAACTAVNSTTPVSTAAMGSTCRPSAPPTGGCWGPRPRYPARSTTSPPPAATAWPAVQQNQQSRQVTPWAPTTP